MNSLCEGHGGMVPPQRCALCRTPTKLDRIEPYADHRGPLKDNVVTNQVFEVPQGYHLS
jgi:hypothetical protein